MAKNWEVFNIDDDNKPEIAFTTDDTNSEKFILRNILLGVYGEPYFEDGTVENGLSSRIVMKFKESDEMTGANYDNVKLLPNWTGAEVLISEVKYYYDNDPQNEIDWLTQDGTQNVPSPKTPSRRHKLFLNVPDYEEIKNMSPKIIIERYKFSKNRANKGWQSAGWKKLSNEFPDTFEITSDRIELDFQQERFFRYLPDAFGNIRVRKKGSKKTYDNNDSVFLKLSLALLQDGVERITNSFVVIKLQASVQYKKDGSLGLPPDTEQYLSISYRLT